jgi:transcriptional regulator with XRE-family HTH domain
MATSANPLPLDRPLSLIRSRLDAASRSLRAGGAPDLAAVRDFVRLLDGCLADLARAAGLDDEQAALVRSAVLQASFPVLLYVRQGELRAAARFLLGTWERRAEAFGSPPLPVAAREAHEVREAAAPYLALEANQAGELLSSFNAVLFEFLRGAGNQGRGRSALRRLMVHLGLSYDQLGRAFAVSGETVRRWERGSHPLPDERLADLVQADAALDRLLAIFRPERLAHGVRRKADLFAGESALDWILRGRIADAADRYESALVYQG